MALFSKPSFVDISLDGTYALVSDITFKSVRAVSIATNVVSTIASSPEASAYAQDGVGYNVGFDDVAGVCFVRRPYRFVKIGRAHV